MRKSLPENEMIAVAHHVARRCAFPPGMDYEDVVQTGLLGMVKGLPLWKPDGGAKISSWAAQCAETAIWRESKRAYTAGRQSNREALSLDAPLGHEPKAGALGELVADRLPGPQEVALYRDELRRILAVASATASENERVVLQMMLADQTLREIGEALNISYERVRQLESSIYARLRAAGWGDRLPVITDVIEPFGDSDVDMEVVEEAWI